MRINPQDFIKNAQKLQEQMGNFQEKMEEVGVTGRAGGGMVEVDMNGRMELNAVRFEQSIVKPENCEMLQDLVQAAVNDAIEKIRGELSSEMGSIVSDISSAFSSDDKS
ncbi:MAG: YbaB/EbfC family nucleoid-associated protein [Spirochaetaceae bacterium]|jgi:DNA-binding YbaB/EbfC family protein|nr:YbaB/EbfC family nucleoid-associated protein [Spirochaetaceae bacterium]